MHAGSFSFGDRFFDRKFVPLPCIKRPNSSNAIRVGAVKQYMSVVGLFVRRLGEPLRSVFTPDAMCALLAKYQLRVVRDRDMRSIGAALSPEVARATRVAHHLHILVAERE